MEIVDLFYELTPVARVCQKIHSNISCESCPLYENGDCVYNSGEGMQKLLPIINDYCNDMGDVCGENCIFRHHPSFITDSKQCIIIDEKPYNWFELLDAKEEIELLDKKKAILGYY